MRRNNKCQTLLLIAASVALAVTAANVFAQATPGFNNKIPSKILTPDSVETRIGTLEFFDGFPTNGTTQKVFDNLDEVLAHADDDVQPGFDGRLYGVG